MNGQQFTYYLKGEGITKNVFFTGGRPEIFSLTQKKCVNDYQYAYTDHLGNVRMIYTSNPGETTFTANMEATPNEADDEFFDGTNNTPDVLATSGTSVTRLMAGQVSGPSLTALPVYPGDTIAMQVQGFYRGGSGTSTTDVSTLIAAVAGSFGGVNGGTTSEQAVFNAFDQAINPALGGFGIQTTETGEVAAYLNYIMFDKNMQVVQHGHWAMDGDALDNPVLMKMWPMPIAQKEGFVYVYLTNESNSEIYFDDFEVTIKESAVVQSNNYYPFGLVTSDSWTRPTDLKNNFLYNAGSELNEETGNYETFYRQYDAAIGRFTGIDIMASKYSSHTPYNYCFNDPVALNDPMGDDVWADMQAWAQGVIEENRSFLYNDGIGSNNAYGYGGNFGAGYGLSSASRRSGYAIGSGYSMASLNSFANYVTKARMVNQLKSGGIDSFDHDLTFVGASGTKGYGDLTITDYFANGDKDRYIDTEYSWSIGGGNAKHVIDQKKLIPANFKSTAFGEKLLYNLREIYGDYRSNGSDDRQRYELRDAVNVNSITKGIGSADHGFFNIAGVRVEIIVVIKGDNNGKYLTSGENEFDGTSPRFSAFNNGRNHVNTMKISPSVTFSIIGPASESKAAKNHLTNMAKFIYGRPTPGFNLSIPNPYGN